MFSQLWRKFYYCNRYYWHSFVLFSVTWIILERYLVICGLSSILDLMKILCFFCNKILQDKSSLKSLSVTVWYWWSMVLMEQTFPMSHEFTDLSMAPLTHQQNSDWHQWHQERACYSGLDSEKWWTLWILNKTCGCPPQIQHL